MAIALRKIRREQNIKDSLHPNMKAFLMMIRVGEGTSDANGYRRLFGGELFNDFSKHPNKVVSKSGYNSTAAGAYQILYRTWLMVSVKLGLDDFSPQSQDAAAVELIRNRGALELVLNGKLNEAIAKTNKEWASLPNSPYGQPTKTLAQATATYKSFGGTIA